MQNKLSSWHRMLAFSHLLYAFLAWRSRLAAAWCKLMALAFTNICLAPPWWRSLVVMTIVYYDSHVSVVPHVSVISHACIVLTTGRYYYRKHHHHHNHYLLHNLHFFKCYTSVLLSGAKVRRFLDIRKWLSLITSGTFPKTSGDFPRDLIFKHRGWVFIKHKGTKDFFRYKDNKQPKGCHKALRYGHQSCLQSPQSYPTASLCGDF